MKSVSRTLRLPLSLAALLSASPLLAQDRMVPPAQLPSYWILLNRSVAVDMPLSGKNLEKPGCVAVSYTIGSDGLTRNVKVRKIVPESGLGPAALSAVKNFKYGPSLSNREEEPVATYYVVPFNSPDDPAQRKQLMAPCQLPGYDAG